MIDPWLTVEQVSSQLQFHPDTVRRLLREDKIKGHRVSRRGGWRIRASEVDRYVTGGSGAEATAVTGIAAGIEGQINDDEKAS